MSEATVDVHRDLAPLLDGRWDALVAASAHDTVFLRSEWLLAWAETLGDGLPVWICSAEIAGNRGAIALSGEASKREMLGRGPSDYLDVVVAAGDEAGRAAVLRTLLDRALREAPAITLTGLVADVGTPARLRGLDGSWVTTLRSVPAPTMDMDAAPAALRKKSIRRHTNGLRRLGDVQVEVATSPNAIAAALPALFDLHVRRWAGTSTPSLFLDPRQRAFYERVVARFGVGGPLRLLTVTLDGRPVAAHFGMLHRGIYTWYKPAFDPDLAATSPGEVLLGALIEDALACGAHELDFTVGDEPFKLRFATRVRRVVDLHVTASPGRALGMRGYLRVRDAAKRRLEESGRWDTLRKALRRS
ncbi:MAG: GNAT family N-acetyltransferase [Myxococcales bacterium]|nr:GNAT family N-acetyltransferase [Myxococcales bacterium]MCB9530801.1 GNAT family N-acetyltransferase [Myxococcales bacterium]